MEGLVFTWAAGLGLLDGPPGEALAAAEARNWARNQLLTAQAVRLEKDAVAHGVEIRFIKGVALEGQFYGRPGERPTTDLDVLVGRGDPAAIARWVIGLQPRHMWVSRLETLVAGGHIQAIDLVVDGVQVDLHFDPLKLEIVAARAGDDLLRRVHPIDVGMGPITTLDPEASLVLALLHLNKDRFRRMIGFADVRRMLERVQDWDWFLAYSRREGITTPLLSSLAVVVSTLGIPPPAQLASYSPAKLWQVVWPEDTRLLGQEGVVRYRYRQMLIPFFAPDRWSEALVGLARRVFPPRPLLDAFFPDTRGGYLTTLLVGRAGRRRQRARQRGAAENEARSDDPTTGVNDKGSTW